MKLRFNKNNFNIQQITAWILLVVSLSALLLYGLSYFFAKPKNETVTVQPTESNTQSKSFLNKTQDVKFKYQPNK